MKINFGILKKTYLKILIDSPKEKLSKFWEKRQIRKETISDDNWYIKTAIASEDVSDAVLREDNGASQKITKVASAKLGSVGTSVGIFSLASIIGTASTGTAIGSLSGAAFNSAALAWVGGSMVAGSVILGVISIAGGVGAAFGAGYVFKKFVYGKKREKSELDEKEQKIIEACLSLATAFRQKEKKGEALDPLVVKALYGDALEPLCKELLAFKSKTESWTSFAKKRVEDTIKVLNDLKNYLNVCYKNSPNATIGTVSAVFLKILSASSVEFNENELLVLEALRGSNNDLNSSSIEELGEYIREKDPSELNGLISSIKGKYHELLFQKNENEDGDEFVVELFEDYNHPAADIKLINTLTKESTPYQLKTTDYLSYIKEHNGKYPDIRLFVNEEMAKLDPTYQSTDILNSEVTNTVKHTLTEKITEEPLDFGVASSMSVAAMITLARNIKVLLKGRNMTSEEQSKLLKDGYIAAGVAGIISLLIG